MSFVSSISKCNDLTFPLLPVVVGLVLAAHQGRRDAGEPHRPRGRNGEPATSERESGQERQAQGPAALALPPEPPGERQRGTIAWPIPRDGEESEWW